MSRSRRKPVQRYHDRVAHLYDHSYENEFWQWHDSLTWDYLKPHLPADLSCPIADLGCGTGKWAAKLLKSGYQVTCIDISHQMLDQARRKIEELGSGKRAAFLQADLMDMSGIADGAFACAVALGDPIGCTEYPQRAMKEIRRALADGGVLIATLDNRLAAIDFYLQQGDAAELVRFLRDGRTHWLTKDAEERFPIHTFAPDDLRRLADATGFTVVEMVGKTVLPLRNYQHLLAGPEDRRTWARIEKSLSRDPAALVRASHLQVVLKKRDGGR